MLSYSVFKKVVEDYVNNINFVYNNNDIPSTQIKVKVNPVKKQGRWGVCVSIRGREKCVSDEWFCNSCMTRKNIRLYSIHPHIQICDDYNYKEMIMVLVDYKWVYDVYWYVDCDVSNGITEFELNKFLNRIKDGLMY